MNRIITLLGVFGFITIVTYLQFIQSAYSPIHQLMSELALGQQGSLMLGAFLSFALSVAGAMTLLTHPVIKGLLGFASLALLGAGLSKLGVATTLHVALIVLAFVLLVLSMYLTPRLITAFQRPQAMAVCWGLGIATAIFVALGHETMPIGLAQRLAAMCLLLWLSWLAIFNSNKQ